MGIWKSLVMGGSGAAAGLAISHYTVLAAFRAMGECFLVVGAIHMLMFLSTHPGPDKLTVETKQTTTLTQTTEVTKQPEAK